MATQPPINGQVGRSEYESRHRILEAQIAQNDARLTSETATLKADIERKFDRVIESLESLRKEVIVRDTLEVRFGMLQAQITRNIADIKEAKELVEKIEQKQMGRAELAAMRIAAAAGFGALIVSLIEIITHIHP